MQIFNFIFIYAATNDILSLKYTYDSLKAVTIANWVVWIALNIAILYSVMKDKPKMILYIHNLILV